MRTELQKYQPHYPVVSDAPRGADPASFKAYWRLLRRHFLLILVIFAIIVAAAYFLTRFQTPRYEAEARVAIKRFDRNSQDDMLGKALPEDAPVSERDVQTQVAMIRSAPVLREAARRSGVPVHDIKKVPVSVEAGKENNIITVIGQSSDPVLAKRLANNVALVYMDRNKNQNRSSARAGREFLEHQERLLEKDLALRSRALRDYETRHGAVGLETATENTVRVLSEAEANLRTFTAEQRSATARVQQIKAAIGRTEPTIVASESIVRDPALEKLRLEVADLTVQRASLMSEYTPTSRKVREIDARIEQAEARMSQMVETIVASKQMSANPLHQSLMSDLIQAEGQAFSATARVQELSRMVAQSRATLRRLPQQQYRLAQLRRDVQSAEKAYLAVKDRSQELRIAEESTLASAEIVELASVPVEPVSPNKKRNMAVGILAGLIIAFGIASMRENSDDSLRTVSDVEYGLAAPLLGLVANIPDAGERSLIQSPVYSHLSEAFRMIRANVRLKTLDQDLRTIMVTSSFSGEGKGTTAANLAIALARIGTRVTLVDADFRRPGVHKHFGLANTVGLGDVVFQGTSLNEALQPSGVPNLNILTTGSVPRECADILESSRFDLLLEDLKRASETVIFDAPPVIGVADASVLASKVDGTLVVLAAGRVSRDVAQRTLRLLEEARSTLLGIVLNRADPSKDTGYQYYYTEYASPDPRRAGKPNGSSHEPFHDKGNKGGLI